jgi:hypothetical protein
MYPVQQRDKGAIRAELEKTRAEFHALSRSLSTADLQRQSKNAAWTNGEVLFHILLAFILVPALFWLIRFFGRLPRAWSKPFAALLNCSTPLFNRLNALGPHIGGRIFPGDRLDRKYDRVHGRILRLLDAIPDAEMRRGMYYPDRWDGLFQPYMTLADLFIYPTVHFRFHREQIATSNRRSSSHLHRPRSFP